MAVACKIDLRSAFHNLTLDEDSRDMTAFQTPFGKYRYTRLAMGFKNASHMLCRYLATLVGDLPTVIIYYDDILLMSHSKEDMFALLDIVLERLDEGGLSLNPQKCILFCSRVEFLGNEITPEGIRVLPAHIDSIQRLKVPQTPKDLRSFLGACQFVSVYVPHYAEWRRNLDPLLRKGAKFEWTGDQMWSWTRIREALINPPVLSFVRFDLRTYIECDASFHSVGSVVFQEYPHPQANYKDK
jgi:hypothetical protein